MNNQSPEGGKEQKHKYFPGNYSNTCARCNKEFYWADKWCFMCSDCIEATKFTPSPQAPSAGIEKEIEKFRKYYGDEPIAESNAFERGLKLGQASAGITKEGEWTDEDMWRAFDAGKNNGSTYLSQELFEDWLIKYKSKSQP